MRSRLLLSFRYVFRFFWRRRFSSPRGERGELLGGERRAAPRVAHAVRDAAALSLLSLIPPDRVGCIRKLRLGHTLKKKEGGGWKMDLPSSPPRPRRRAP